MAAEPIRLPGIGHRLHLKDDQGRPLVVIRRKDGSVELHGLDHLVLDPSSAAMLGGFAAGHLEVAPELAARTGGPFAGIRFDWVEVPARAAAVGRSIGELGVRRRTGTTVVAILRGPHTIVDPDPDQRLVEGDLLVVAAAPHERAALRRFLVEGG